MEVYGVLLMRLKLVVQYSVLDNKPLSLLHFLFEVERNSLKIHDSVTISPLNGKHHS